MTNKVKNQNCAPLNIDRAIAYANEHGIAIIAADLIRKCWPDRAYKSAWEAYDALRKGKAKTVNIDIVRIICETTGASADLLFNITKERTPIGF